jgi:pimeloyl-ACP methyl ester carboxylesterase
MGTFVLVPGAWHGGWCYRDVAQTLRARGHTVFPVTLTGVGERFHLGSADTNLSTHIQDVAAVIAAEELENVIVVGHSYAGMVVSGIAERHPQYLRALVYVDALVPENEEMMFDLTSAEFRAMAMADARQSCGGYLVAPPSVEFLGVDAAHAAWVTRRLTAHPIGTATERLTLGATDRSIPRHYIACDSPSLSTTLLSKERVRRDPSWTIHSLNASHEAIINCPGTVCDILHGIANPQSMNEHGTAKA